MEDQQIFPFRFHTEEDRVRNYLVTRGYCYRKLAGVHNRFCDGPAKFYLT